MSEVMGNRANINIPERVGEAAEINYGGPADADFGPLTRDLIPVRSMVEGDLHALIAIDRRITGRNRSAYFERKLEEALRESDVRISLVAERDGRPVGFIMARVTSSVVPTPPPSWTRSELIRIMATAALAMRLSHSFWSTS